jgi:LmbE family N-acetylglucosaminyl deacetylase
MLMTNPLHVLEGSPLRQALSGPARMAAAAAAGLALTLCCQAAESPPAVSIADGAGGETWMLTDGDRTTKRTFSDGASLRVTSPNPASAVYLIWDSPPENGWTLTADEKPVEHMVCGFLHEYVPLPSPFGLLHISWEGAARLCDIHLLEQGEEPDWVQIWRPAEGRADLLLLPTHADDEHLFFGGIMPLYADGGYEIQVAYMVNHNGEPYRPHELLDGLWAAGVRRYPVIPDFPDVYSDSLEHAKTIYDQKALLDYQISLLVRFTPQVVVGHDLNGEYGHGAHMLNAHTLLQSVESAAAAPGGWDTPKTYLHLYPEGPVVLDYDRPLASFGGKTAFEVACEGFAKHISQQAYFSVEQSGPYDCRRFGLARSTVGTDRRADDLFENLTAYGRQAVPPAAQPARDPPGDPAAALPAGVPPGAPGSLDDGASPRPKSALTAAALILGAAALWSAAAFYRRRRAKNKGR